MAYTAYLNNHIFFSTASQLEGVALLTAELDLQAGQAGTFTFSLAPDNVAYNNFRKLKSFVDVYHDNSLIFSGRVIEISEDFQLVRTIVCEGLLAILADSVFRPVTANVSLQNLVQAMIDSHNAQVGSDKQLTIGTITIEDEYVYRAYEEYDTTIQRLMDLVDSYGGYMTVTKQSGTLYFDWRESIAGLNDQGINFGQNLLDITQSESATDIITVLVPLGAQIENEDGTQTRLTIADVNNGNDYLVNSDGVAEFGQVVGIQVWDDVNVPSILKSKGEAFLNKQVVNKVSINVSAADLASVQDDVSSFEIGQTIRVKSEAHGIDSYFIALEQHLNLLDPSQNQMTLGNTVRGYISTLSKAVKTNKALVESVIHDYVTNESMTARNTALEQSIIQQTSDMIRTEVETVNNSIDGYVDRLTAVEQTSTSWTVFAEQNGEVLTYLRLDTDNPNPDYQGLYIGRSNDPIQLLETNKAIKFIDGNGTPLLEINTEGIITPSVSASEQVAFLYGSTPEWAIRKGAIVNNKHNLNDLWIGG